MSSARHQSARSSAAIAAADPRALVVFVIVNILSLALILSTGAALLRGT